MTKKEWKSKAKFYEELAQETTDEFVANLLDLVNEKNELQRKLDIANGTVAKLMKENATLNKISVKLDNIRHKRLL